MCNDAINAFVDIAIMTLYTSIILRYRRNTSTICAFFQACDALKHQFYQTYRQQSPEVYDVAYQILIITTGSI